MVLIFLNLNEHIDNQNKTVFNNIVYNNIASIKQKIANNWDWETKRLRIAVAVEYEWKHTLFRRQFPLQLANLKVHLSFYQQGLHHPQKDQVLHLSSWLPEQSLRFLVAQNGCRTLVLNLAMHHQIPGEMNKYLWIERAKFELNPCRTMPGLVWLFWWNKRWYCYQWCIILLSSNFLSFLRVREITFYNLWQRSGSRKENTNTNLWWRMRSSWLIRRNLRCTCRADRLRLEGKQK